MFALSFGAAFGAIQQMPQIASAMPDVAAQTVGKPVPAQKEIEQKAASDYSKVQEIGGLVGRFILALLVVRIVSRRNLLRVFLIPGLFVLPVAFGYLALHNQELFTIANWHVTSFDIGIFLAGLFTVPSSVFGATICPAFTRSICAAPAKVSPPTSAAA